MSYAEEDDEVLEISYMDVVAYVEASAHLAECLVADIKRGKGKSYISTSTVLALSKFTSAAKSMRPLLDFAQKDMLKLN